ncbi:ABC transporter ATP-binding protein [Limnothrix sp. FACHB-1083]|uniref:ABC transporter ATP-binding protein n=1 Tax=unclassified Limnothrix TaxID=2632864 RepID=UPI0016806734|nr:MULTISPECIES: ABC transporter ATP-binding protein [unclassified Limnothrix]MBD2161790.1 ABC transporter ATP-binding protein [Limnothrix sp. FACHB-1083]MBD2192633.1 ABC transporter ATP-binding protein [Limnothrix sp. FACHB-1088]
MSRTGKGRSHYWQLWPFVRAEAKTIALALACTVGFTAFWPVLAWLPGQLAEPIGTGQPDKILQLAGLAALIFLVRGAFQYGQDTLMAKAALRVAMTLRVRLYGHLQTLSLDYFERSQTGDLAYRLTGDVDRVGDAVGKVFHQFVPCVLQLVVVLGYMIYLNWQLTLATFAIAPLIAVLIAWFGDRLLSFARRSQDRIAGLAATIAEILAGIRLVQAFGAERTELDRFRQEAEAARHAKLQAAQAKAAQFVIVGFLEAMSVLVLFWLGSWQIGQGNLTGAGFISYVTAVALLIDPISITTSNYNEFKESEASVDRLFELLAVPPTVRDRPGAQPLPTITGRVEFRAIEFAYPSAAEPVLQGLDLTVRPGEAIALVGASGAGKSTIVNLLLRFYDPQGGQVCIDGIDLREVTLNSLRQQIAIVPQETILFSGSIAQNIALGNPKASRSAIEQAAQIANAHDFISQLSEGYNTWVGERGANLSGGQRQRIAIARAVLRDPKILILDEATSALDSESESLVQEALDRLRRDRTTLTIAHRLATVRGADRILVVEKGQIVESGSHDQLLAQNGRYAAYYARQFRE